MQQEESNALFSEAISFQVQVIFLEKNKRVSLEVIKISSNKMGKTSSVFGTD